jgi:potassium-transporting ATPase KdpC subunit
MKTLIIAVKIFLFFTILTGIIYPLLITGIVQVAFPSKANGSLIERGNKTIGSELIAQPFDSVIYFMSRPSAILYKPLPSGGSNYGLTNTKLENLVAECKQKFIAFNQLDSLTVIPSEMLFASASGLDPHISPEAALLQVNRISKARNLNDAQKDQLKKLINSLVENPQFGFFGESRINVLRLNLKIDSTFSK